MTTYAHTDDVAAELGRPASSASETTQWSAWLDRVERSIRRRFRREGYELDERISLGAPTIEDVRDVEVAAVLRKIANPTGITSTTRSIDDASVTTRREGGDGGDPLLVTDDEWDALLPARRRPTRAFSVMPS